MPALELTAKYVSPTGAKDISAVLPSLPTKPEQLNVNEKTDFLTALRHNVQDLQGQVNEFLTKKMEEDKANEAGQAGAKGGKEEDLAEERYGEEEQESDG